MRCCCWVSFQFGFTCDINIYIYIIVFWHQTMYPLYVRITLEPLFAKVVQIHVLFFLDAWQILRKMQEHFFGKWCSLYQVLKCTCSFTNGFSSLFPEVSSVHFFVWAKGIACLDSYFCQTLQPWMLFFFDTRLCKQATPLLFIRYYSFWVILDFHVHFSCLIRHIYCFHIPENVHCCVLNVRKRICNSFLYIYIYIYMSIHVIYIYKNGIYINIHIYTYIYQKTYIYMLYLYI